MSAADGSDPREDVTELLAAARAGDSSAAERLFAAVYADLKRIARRQLGGAGETLSPTALVHEAYLRLARPGALGQHDRTHFFAVAARAMRQILVDHARRKAADKRGGGIAAGELDEGRIAAGGETAAEDLLALDAALARLAAADERLARVVELRFFGGLELAEIADVVGVSERTLKRDWRRARAFLYREITGAAPADASPPAGPEEPNP